MFEVSSLSHYMAVRGVEPGGVDEGRAVRSFIEGNLDLFADCNMTGPFTLDEAIAFASCESVVAENDTRYVDVKDTAVEVRKVLKEKFPKTKFSVRSSRYSKGESVHISWDDGPTESAVDNAVTHLKGKRRDPVDDSDVFVPTEFIKDGRLVRHQHTAHIHASRGMSKEFLGKVAPGVPDASDHEKAVYRTARNIDADTMKHESRSEALGVYIVQEADRVFVPDSASKSVEDWAKKRGVVVRFRKGVDPKASEVDMLPQAKKAFLNDFAPPSTTMTTGT